jgi:hypothetical protein
VASLDDFDTKNFDYGSIWNRRHVRPAFFSPPTIPLLFPRALTPRTRLVSLTIHHIICIVSIVCLVALYQINNSDLTWSNEPPGLWTFLEPALSIINTCLPVTQPVADKALKFFGVKGSSSTNRSWNTSSAAKQPSAMHGNGDARNFTRLDDHTYPLTEGIGTYNHISGPGSKEIADSYDLKEPESAYGRDSSASEINVRKDWEVKTSASVPRPSLFGNVSKEWENDPSAGVPLPLPHGL